MANLSPMKRITVTVETTDGRERTWKLIPAHPDAPFAELDWERPPVEDVEETLRTGFRTMKPGPTVLLTLRATGHPEA